MIMANGAIDVDSKAPDAGMRSEIHYRKRLPKWRYALRDFFIPVIRSETPVLAFMQHNYRTPALDSYFAITATLGTHTFFMVFLPILFWCGYYKLARALIHVLASGVFFTGFLKDLLCLPRPLSPPLQRISKSTSAALEYGFPSTHSTNSASVVVYALFLLRYASEPWILTLAPLFQFLLYSYLISIILGRLYCGMHGFSDVVIGTVIGVVLALVQCVYGDSFDVWIHEGTFTNVLVVTSIILTLVRIHPEPADDCPCFDDSVAFSGVFIGAQIGGWHLESYSATLFQLSDIGLIKAVARLIVGVLLIFAWRASMKSILLRILPPIFRVVETLGLSLPRKYFLNASQYGTVPTLRKDDNVIPHASEIPAMLNSLRHPRRRAISVGPQSEADAYESMAFRERRRRESLSNASYRSQHSPKNSQDSLSAEDSIPSSQLNAIAPSNSVARPVIRKAQSAFTTTTINGSAVPATAPSDSFAADDIDDNPADDARNDKAMFLKLQRPRVRYDVEVVTKLIVYAGIGWIAVEGGTMVFELVGLGMAGKG